MVYVVGHLRNSHEDANLASLRINATFYKLVLGIGVGTLFGVLSANVSPFTIGALIDDLGFAPERAGFLVTIELATLALAAILVSPILNRAGISRVALIGILVTLGGQAFTFFVTQYESLLLVRVITAIGFGLLYASANAAGARAENPDTVFSLAITFSLVVLALLLPLVGKVVASHGFSGLVLSVLFIVVIFAPALCWLKTSQRPGPESVVHTRIVKVPELALLFLIISLFSASTGAAWTFMERVGVSELGLKGEQIGLIIGLSTVAGIFGAFSVSWFSKRVSRRYPVMLGILVAGLASFLLTSGYSVPLFVAGGILYWGSYMLVYPYLIGIACDLDSSGRGAAASAGILMLSFALGPFLAASITAIYDYRTLGVLCLGACLAATGLAGTLLNRATLSGARS